MVPNCSAKAKGEKQTLVGDQLAESNEISQLVTKRPFDRVRGGSLSWQFLIDHLSGSLLLAMQGYLVNFDQEREIWGRVLKHVLKVRPGSRV